jgi:hypothetical protein
MSLYEIGILKKKFLVYRREILNILYLKIVGFWSFYTQGASICPKQAAHGPSLWYSSCANRRGTAIPLKEIAKFACFQHVGECCGDVQFPTSPLAFPAPPDCEPYTPLPAGGARRLEAHIYQAGRLEFAFSSRLISQAGRHAAAHAPHLGRKRPSRIPIQHTHPATEATSTQHSTSTCEHFTLTLESIRDFAPDNALGVVTPQRRGRRRLTVGAWQYIGAESV